MYIPKSVLWGCALTLLVAIGAGLWWMGIFNGLTSALHLDILSQQEEMPQEVAEEPAPQNELATGSDSSDQALEEDMSQLDAELEAYGQTSAELDSSLEDESVPQEY